MLRGRRSSSCRGTVPLLRQQVFHAGDAFAEEMLWDNFPGTCTFHPQNVSKTRNSNKHHSGTVLFLTQIVQQLVQGPETFSGTCSSDLHLLRDYWCQDLNPYLELLYPVISVFDSPGGCTNMAVPW